MVRGSYYNMKTMKKFVFFAKNWNGACLNTKIEHGKYWLLGKVGMTTATISNIEILEIFQHKHTHTQAQSFTYTHTLPQPKKKNVHFRVFDIGKNGKKSDFLQSMNWKIQYQNIKPFASNRVTLELLPVRLYYVKIEIKLRKKDFFWRNSVFEFWKCSFKRKKTQKVTRSVLMLENFRIFIFFMELYSNWKFL